MRLPWLFRIKESTCQCRKCTFDLRVGKIPWGRKWQLIRVFLEIPGNPTDRGGWWAIGRAVSKSQTQLSD